MSTHPQIFQQEILSIPEIAEFYSLENIVVPESKPYTWTMTVSTLDGYISFKDLEAEGAKEISLGHINGSGSGSDWRLLNGGWMFADAILGSGSILRSEPDMVWIPHFEDLVEHRVNVLKKSKYPISVIVTASGVVDLKHKMFHYPDLKTILITTKEGYEKIKPNLGDLTPATSVEIVGDTMAGGGDFAKIFEILRKKYDVKIFGCDCGWFGYRLCDTQ